MARDVLMPPEVQELDLLDRLDYTDSQLAATDQELPAEAWGRLALEVAPAPMLGFAWLVQRFLLGLELSRPNAQLPMGTWTRIPNPDFFVMAADGPLAHVRLVGFTADGGIGIATLMALPRMRQRVLWAGIAPIHRAFARNFLDRAVREATRRS